MKRKFEKKLVLSKTTVLNKSKKNKSKNFAKRRQL